jgi:translation initiation factor IF-2
VKAAAKDMEREAREAAETYAKKAREAADRRAKEAAEAAERRAKAAREAAEKRANDAAWFAELEAASVTFPEQQTLAALSAADLKKKLTEEVRALTGSCVCMVMAALCMRP